ncbi:hypothetical protein Trydic_g9839 [Trypoxylus dichotomus]
MGYRCVHPHKETPGVPEPDTTAQRSLVRKEHHPSRRRRSRATHGLHSKNSHPILEPSSRPLEPPRVGVSGSTPAPGHSSWATKTDSSALSLLISIQKWNPHTSSQMQFP